MLLLPVYAGPAAPDESAAALDSVFGQALQDQNRFEVVVYPRSECLRRFGRPALAAVSALPHDFISYVQRVYAADAVMFVDMTAFRAYHPLAIGIRARLAVVNNTRIVWACDHLFAADDPLVAAAARRFFSKNNPQGVPADLSRAVLQSPAKFAAYAAHATFATLPPVTLGKSTQTSVSRR